MYCKTIRIKSSHPPSQGDFIEINASDFNSEKHELFVPPLPAVPSLPPLPAVPSLPPLPVDPLANLPKDWRERDNVRSLAAAVSGRSVENKKQAIQVIEAALKARS